MTASCARAFSFSIESADCGSCCMLYELYTLTPSNGIEQLREDLITDLLSSVCRWHYLTYYEG